MINVERVQSGISRFLDRHGFPALAYIGMFCMFIGVFDSPLTETRDLMIESKKSLDNHIEEVQKENQKTSTRLLATCVNPALAAGHETGVRICMEDNEYLQKRLIERAIITEEGKK